MSRLSCIAGEKKFSIAVLGTGNGAHALVADLALAGHAVHWGCIYNPSNENWAHVMSTRKLKWDYQGDDQFPGGTIEIKDMYNNIVEPAQQADILFISTTADRHDLYLNTLLSANVLANKTIVFTPGHFAALRLMKLAYDGGIKQNFSIAETSCHFYAARIQTPGHIRVKAIKQTLFCGVFPAADTGKVLHQLRQLHRQLEPVENVLAASIRDHCIIMHPTTTVFNASHSGQTSGQVPASFYHISEQTGRMVDNLDEEKQHLQQQLGLERKSLPSVLEQYYNLPDPGSASSYITIRKVPCYEKQTMSRLESRYVSEDVPFGLVVLALLARQYNVASKYMTLVITSAEGMNGREYMQTGYNLNKLGIDHMSISELNYFLQTGKRGVLCQCKQALFQVYDSLWSKGAVTEGGQLAPLAGAAV